MTWKLNKEAFVHPFLSDVKTLFLDTLFPVYCLACSREGVFLCLECKNKLTLLEYQQCIVCSMPSLFGLTHPKCSTRYLPDGLVAVFDYRDPNISRAIILGKYSFIVSIFEIFGEDLASFLDKPEWKELLAGFSLVPLPLAKSRRRWRGFNQAEVLTARLSEKLGLSLEHTLVRKATTKVQKDLNREERIKNVAGCFNLNPGIDVRGKNYIIIDDVVTTGATLIEACKVLKRNGADKVWCVTVARD